VSLLCFNRLMSPLIKDEKRRDSLFAFIMSLKSDRNRVY